MKLTQQATRERRFFLARLVYPNDSILLQGTRGRTPLPNLPVTYAYESNSLSRVLRPSCNSGRALLRVSSIARGAKSASYISAFSGRRHIRSRFRATTNQWSYGRAGRHRWFLTAGPPFI